MPRTKQTATKPRAKSASKATKSRSRTPKRDIVFTKGTVVAIPGKDYEMNFKLVQLRDDVFESTKTVKADYLVRLDEELFEVLLVKEGVIADVARTDIIGEADVTVTSKKLKKKGPSEICFELRTSSLALLKKKATALKGGRKRRDESSSEDEEESEEESEEEEEEKPKGRQTKKVVGKKTKKDEEEEEEDDKKKTDSTPRRSTRGRKGSAEKEEEEVSRSTKKQKNTAKKGKATKKDELDEEEESEEEEEEDTKKKGGKKPAAKGGKGKKGKKDEEEEEEEEEEDTKGKKGKKKAGDEKEKKKRTPKQPTKYKKGKFNPDVEVIEKSEVFDGTSNDPIEYGNAKYNDRNLIRAVHTKNYKLLEKLLKKDYFLSSLFERWAPDSNFNAIELAFKNNDKKAVQLISQAYGNRGKLKFAAVPQSGLETFNTGSQSIYAFGVMTRKVEMGRGGKELINAYLKDTEHTNDFDDVTMRRILETVADTDLLDTLKVDSKPASTGTDSSGFGYYGGNYDPFESLFNEAFDSAVTSGNIKAAEYIAKVMVKNGGFGIVPTHADALTKAGIKGLSTLRKTSCTAKTYQTNITPIHFACINPNTKVLQSLLGKAPEYSITDAQMRKPIHFAAACESPENLKLLLKHSVDFREGDRQKMTPLMVAAKYGRDKNMEVLLELKEPAIITQKNKEGNMAIHLAAERGHLNCIKLLHKYEVDLNVAGKNRMTPLIIAAANGHFEVVEWLLQNGGKILKKDKFKRHALILAVMNGHLKIASFLLKNGAEFNHADSSSITSMHYAAAYGFEECIDVLKKAGADQNAADAQNLTPLTVAMLKNNLGTMKKLLSYPDTDVNCKDNQGRTLIMVAIDTINNQNLEHIQYLLKEKNADPNITDAKGYNALHYACNINVENLVNRDPRSYNAPIETREEIREEYRKLQSTVINTLLAHKININHAGDDGITPFFLALGNSNFPTCELLMQQKDLDISLISKEDEGIYHSLARIITNEKAIELFNKVAKSVGNKNNLAALANSTGFTPFLTLMQTFGNQAYNVLSQIFNNLRNDKLQQKQKAWDEKHKTPISTTKPEAKLRGGARTKQTARRGGGGLFSGGRVFQSGGGGGGLFGQTQVVNDPFDSRPVNLTAEEIEQVHKEAEQKFEEYIQKFIAVCKELIALGASPLETVQKLRDFRGEKGKKGNKTSAELLLQNLAQKKSRHPGKDVEYCNEGAQNALHLIQSFPHPTLLKFLIGLGSIDINHQDYLDRTPLHYFIERNSETIGFSVQAKDILNTLLEAKADPNKADAAKDTPLLIAVKENHFNFVERLGKAGANLNIFNSNNESPLILSVQQRLLKQVETLLRAGANPNLADNLNRTALHHAINLSKASSDASFEMEETLLRHGANTSAQDHRGRTPLHYAFITIGNPFEYSHIDPVEVVTSLCSQKGCDVKVKDKWGSTPLHYAAQRGAQVCALTLLKKGAEVDAVDEDGNTPLALALHAKHSDVAIMLIQSKANVNGEVIVKKKEMWEEEGKGDKSGKMEIETKKAVVADDDEDEEGDEDEGAMEEEGAEGEEGEEGEEMEEEGGEDDLIGGEELLIDEEDIDGARGLDDVAEAEEEPADYDNEIVEDDEEPMEDEDEDEDHYDEDEEEEEDYYHRPAKATHHRGGANNLLDLPEGRYSMFTVAIKRDYQGVAYLLLQHGYNLSRAIQDSMNEHKFSYVWTLLTKVSDDSIIRKTNENGQNLYHTFAIKGALAPQVLTQKIHNAFMEKKIDFNAKDNEGKTPLHYAADAGFRFLMEELLKSGADVNAQDKNGNTPFTIQVIQPNVDIAHYIDLYIKYKANFTLKFIATIKGNEIEIGPLNYLVSKGVRNLELLKLLINNGLSVNEVDENGCSALVYAIRQNSKKLIKFLLSFPDFDKNLKDNDGKTVIHHIVNPLDYGSYENEEILELLAPYFDINAPDSQGRPPIYYAYLQDSGVMVAKLKALGATDNKPAANIKRAVTSVVGTMSWPEQEINYEEDAEKFLEDVAKLEKETMEVEETVEPDHGCIDRHNSEVVKDPVLGPYDLYMTKVDMKKGPYGGNLYYKMQVVRNKIRDVYTLVTRWGRIGEHGQSQNTPFSTKDECVKEFCKIFRQKSANEWEDKENFKREVGKYRLLKFTRKAHHKDYLVPFDLKNRKVPKAELKDEGLVKIMTDVTDVQLYKRALNQYHIDTEVFPLARIEKSVLYEAQTLLLEIKEIQHEIEVEEKKISTTTMDLDVNTDKTDYSKILELKEKIIEKSNSFYELIPDSKFRRTPVVPIEHSYTLVQKLQMIDNLLDFELSSKVMLGALSKQYEMNPLDYCFKSLNVNIMRLPDENPEYNLIKKYILASKRSMPDDYIVNIFALERKGEAQRISQWSHLKNRTLLWHGSKTTNFMGTLAQGLKIAPPQDGDSKERGVMFSDMFTASYSYCDHSVNYKLLFLCEVTLGDVYETMKTEREVEELPAPYKSVKVLGRQGPKLNKKVVLPNGCVAPIGKVVDYYKGETDYEKLPQRSQNEYIVYDVSQTRIRYLVQVK